MKTKFNTYDIICSVTELQRLVGMRVAQIYDIDNKTYLIKLQRTEEKCVLLLESGSRFHTTAFDWPKNVAPSGFSMKMRKHLRNKRLESLKQLGVDRIVDLQFGTGFAAYHVILELYDRGNIILTDCDMTILYILRPHVEGEHVRFAIREKYPTDRAHSHEGSPSIEKLQSIFSTAKEGETLKKILNPQLDYGGPMIDHVLLQAGFPNNCKFKKQFNVENDLTKLHEALKSAENLLLSASQQPSKGYILQKKEKRPMPDGSEEDFFTNLEFHPMIFEQHKNQPFREFDAFDSAVDEFFSTLESQKIDIKALQMEKEAMKKLANVRKDHDQRLEALEKTQEIDKQRAELITRNQQLVDDAIIAVRSAIANQMPWPDIQTMVSEQKARGHPVAKTIVGFKLNINHITLQLSDPYADGDYSDEEIKDVELKPMTVDIDLDLTAYSNARRYYDQKRSAAKKQQKTIESQSKAFKSAEKKTKQTLKEVQAITNISKARKVFWFEKFHWFISSENYLVIGGRDPKQNELIVKRYMRAGDIYVHADVQGASSIVIKNPSAHPVPPKTLNEAGVMAMSYSVAWDAKVVTSAWWVHSDQVSKTAPTGEYLITGGFMIRGKKNFLPPSHLIMGFSFLFKLEDCSVERHKDERKIRGLDDDSSVVSSMNSLSVDQEEEIELIESDEDDGNELQNVKSNQSTEITEDVKSDEPNVDEIECKSEVSEDESAFPDVEIRITHSTIQPDVKVTNPTLNKKILPNDVPQKNPRPRNDSINKDTKEQCKEINSNKSQQQQIKRGQRGKLKKIKEKYKDQDEEDRQLVMNILKSAGNAKETKKNKKGSKEVVAKSRPTEKRVPQSNPVINKPLKADGEESDGAEEEPTVAADVNMLESLTGIPVSEDELLFAIPVVAPYSTLLNYKFKVKLTPGTGKRGKAAKTALNIFLKDRNTLPREKDLIRSVKDEDLARNIPGKVKISAPQLQKLRK